MAPVIATMSDLIRKLDDLQDTSQRYIGVMGYDNGFARTINQRVQEVIEGAIRWDGTTHIDGTPDEWAEVANKAVTIKRVLTQKEIAILNNAYYAS